MYIVHKDGKQAFSADSFKYIWNSGKEILAKTDDTTISLGVFDTEKDADEDLKDLMLQIGSDDSVSWVTCD